MRRSDGAASHRTSFDLVWRGYDPEQVERHLDTVEADLRLVIADRDAAVSCSEDLLRSVEAARAENHQLRERFDRICRTPIPADALADRLGRMLELAQQEAEEIIARAHANAGLAAESDEAARRDREQVVHDLDREIDERRRNARQVIVAEVDAARADAARLVRDANDEAGRIIADAYRTVDELRRQRDRVASQLRTAQRLLRKTAPLSPSDPKDQPVGPPDLGATST